MSDLAVLSFSFESPFFGQDAPCEDRDEEPYTEKERDTEVTGLLHGALNQRSAFSYVQVIFGASFRKENIHPHTVKDDFSMFFRNVVVSNTLPLEIMIS